MDDKNTTAIEMQPMDAMNAYVLPQAKIVMADPIPVSQPFSQPVGAAPNQSVPQYQAVPQYGAQQVVPYQPGASPYQAPGVSTATASAVPVNLIALDFDSVQDVPDKFWRCPGCCFACRLCNCESGCFGYSFYSQFLCLEVDVHLCKSTPPGFARLCCICYQAQVEIVSCQTSRCRGGYQLCCFQVVGGCPYQGSYFAPPLIVLGDAAPDGTKLYPMFSTCICGVCGGIDSIYTKYPDCVGFVGTSECLCDYLVMQACIPSCLDSSRRKQKLQCVALRYGRYCVNTSTCSRSRQQMCCYERRFACPFDPQVPCICMPLPFLTCCVSYGCLCKCCGTMQEFIDYNKNHQANSRAL